MNFLSNFTKGDDKPTSDQPQPLPEKHSNYDLFGSTKIVADAAQSQFRNEPEKFDKAKVAGAGADIIGSASEYGKLDETKGVGKYADQAETYLRQYSGSTSPGAVPPSGEPKKVAEVVVHVPSEEKTSPPPPAAFSEANVVEKPAHAGESAEKGECGYGDLAKLAGGFFKK